VSRRILIVKTSSIGDVLQAFSILPLLKKEGFIVDWVIDDKHKKLCFQNPLIDRVIVSDVKGWLTFKNSNKSFLSFRRDIQKHTYEKIFDLQGNWKSSFLVFFAKGKKVGYGKKTVREKINLLFTDIHIDVPKSLNIRNFYKKLFSGLLQKDLQSQRMIFSLSDQEKTKIEDLKTNLFNITDKKVFVSVNSNWENKRLSNRFIEEFLQKVDNIEGCHFFFSWGTEEEKAQVVQLSKKLKKATVLEKLSFPEWQQVLEQMDLLFATDSSFLSLCQLTTTPSFSFFGPTKGSVFTPLGNHGFYQGACPYKISFTKQCPKLRTCKTGSCIKDLDVEDCFLKYTEWKESSLKANQN